MVQRVWQGLYGKHETCQQAKGLTRKLRITKTHRICNNRCLISSYIYIDLAALIVFLGSGIGMAEADAALSQQPGTVEAAGPVKDAHKIAPQAFSPLFSLTEKS